MAISISMGSKHTREYTLLTLVDITNTKVTHGSGLERDQQRNWETILQTIGLCAQPMNIQGPMILEGPLDSLEFGDLYQGSHRVWVMNFSVEHDDVWASESDPVDGLKRDFEQVPVITGLTETAKFMLPIFYPHGSIKNIYFKPTAFDLNIL
jgi:hypothetical protein